METRARHFWIGLFTLGLAAAALGFGLWLAGADLRGERQAYRIVFREDVTGLAPGSPVRYNGISVGELEHLALDEADPRRVVARIRITADTPVRQDTRAQISTSGLFTGGAHIRLIPGSPESPPVERPAEGPASIPAQRSPIARLRTEGDALLSEIDTFVERANRLLSPENLERIHASLEHLEQTTAALAAQRDELRRGVAGFAEAGTQAESTLAEADALLQRAEALLAGPGSEALKSTARAAAALERSSRSAERLLAENRQALSSGAQGLEELGPALAELHRTLAAFRRLARRLEEDPGQLLRRQEIEEYEP